MQNAEKLDIDEIRGAINFADRCGLIQDKALAGRAKQLLAAVERVLAIPRSAGTPLTEYGNGFNYGHNSALDKVREALGVRE